MTELWKEAPGFEGRYEVSNAGRVRSVARLVRYTHWRSGAELMRQAACRLIAQQPMNSGYYLAHLHVDNKRTAVLVHRLVAKAFLVGPEGETVNHINGIKTDNRAVNLEWASYTENHLHAVRLGLNKSAKPYTDAASGRTFPSIAQAAKVLKRNHRSIRKEMHGA